MLIEGSFHCRIPAIPFFGGFVSRLTFIFLLFSFQQGNVIL